MIDPTPRQTHGTAALPGPRSHRARHLLVATLFGTALVLAACSTSGGSTATTAAPSGPTASTGTTSSGSAGHTIAIKNFMFSPGIMTVRPGATVTVTNDDQVDHTITSSKGGFDTGHIAPGQSKTFTAPNTPGRYSYICSIHQYMTGTVVVTG